jgi:Ca-activated chloride channel family protein
MNRLPHDNTTTTPAFGLVAWLEATRVTLPLKGVECRFDVTAGIASVEIDQIFQQDNDTPLDCIYTFPLPAGAAVYRCEMHINGRTIRAKVEEQEKARTIYRDRTAAGYRAAFLEVERENLFTLSLGNVQPGDVIVIRFAYFQTLERIAGSLSLRVPVCPGIRYIPGEPLLRSASGRGASDDTDQVPDASRISPPRIDALHPDAAYFAVSGRLAASDAPPGSLSSPSHAVLVRENADALEVTLAIESAVPDRDFILRWTEPREAALAPHAWCSRAAGETFALVQLRAPADTPVAKDFPQDVYFLIDRSDSMAGEKWVKACEALRAFVDLLGESDRVWITLFESHHRDFAEKPLPVARLRGDAQFQRLVELGTGYSTELQPAAKHVMERIKCHSKDRRALVVLITDGQLGNERAIVDIFRATPQLTVFTFGIDTVVNDAFLRDLARQTGGECWLQTPSDDIAGTVAKLANRLRRPVLTGLRIDGNWEAPSQRLPDLFGGQVIDLTLRRGGKAPAALALTGTLADGREHRFQIPLESVANPALALLWARDRIAVLLASGDRAGMKPNRSLSPRRRSISRAWRNLRRSLRVTCPSAHRTISTWPRASAWQTKRPFRH